MKMAKVKVVRVLLYEYESEQRYLDDKSHWLLEHHTANGSMKMTSTHLFEIEKEEKPNG
jgi:hypothetical protein